MLNFNPLKSKTFWAGVAGAASVLLTAVAQGDPITLELVLQAIAIVLGAIGVRDAVGGPTRSSP